MYCKKCGKEAREGDMYCSNCGAPLSNTENAAADSQSTDTSSGVKKPDTSEFVWDVYDFNKPARKVENVRVDWEKGIVTEEPEIEMSKPEPEISEPEPEISAPEPETAQAAEGSFQKTQESEEPAGFEMSKEQVQKDEAFFGFDTKESEEAKPFKNEFAGIEIPEIDSNFSWTAGINREDIESGIVSEEKPEGESESTDIPVTLEDIQRDAEVPNRNRERDTARIDKFYTLNRKNEEFQKLLDMEYERIKAGREGSYIMPELVKATDNKQEETYNEVFDPVEHLKRAEAERNAALGIGATKAGMAESYAPLNTERKAEESAAGENTASIENSEEEMRIFDTMELQKDVLESRIAADKKSKDELINEISGRIASTKQDVEKTYSSLLDEIFGQINQERQEQEDLSGVQDDCISEKLAGASGTIADAISGAAGTIAGAISGASGIGADTEVQSQYTEEKPCPSASPENEGIVSGDERKTEGSGSAEKCENESLVSSEMQENEARASLDTSDDERANKLEELYNNSTYEQKKSGGAGKVIAVLLVLVLLAGLAVIGIKYLLPDSPAAAAINDRLSQISQMMNKDKEDGENGDSDKEGNNDNTDNSDVTDEPDTKLPDRSVPTADKTQVIASLASINKNIASITSNADVKYDENHKYNSSTVYKTEPLSSNVLFAAEDGSVSYVDEEALKALITYDSAWIDYVNNKDNSIFGVLKEGSDAYRNTKAWNAPGVTKSFNSLEIGEIRQDANGYYVWAKESISTTSNGKTTTDEYNWVYYMEPQDGKLLIVDYYK